MAEMAEMSEKSVLLHQWLILRNLFGGSERDAASRAEARYSLGLAPGSVSFGNFFVPQVALRHNLYYI
jgi:hypothetical protein